jgi:hypothetical protein
MSPPSFSFLNTLASFALAVLCTGIREANTSRTTAIAHLEVMAATKMESHVMMT